MSDRLYDRNFALTIISQTGFVIANTLMAHYARWIEFLQGDLSQIGSIMGIGAMVGLFLRPWMAGWINRLGAKTMWAVGYGVFSVSALGNLLLHDIDPLIYIIRATNVLGTAIVFASSLTYVSQTTPETRRTEAIGILGVGGFLGMLIGPYLGDVFLAADVRQRGDFVLLFLVASAANVVPLMLLLLLRPPKNARVRGPVHLSEFVAICRRYWPGTILLINVAFGVCMTAPFVFVASFVDEVPVRMGGISVIGMFFWCYAGLAIFLRVGLRRLPDQIGSKKVLAAGSLLMSVGMFSYALVDQSHSWSIIVPALLCGAGHGLMFHTMTSLTLQWFPIELRGTGSSLALMMLDLGMIGGAPILGIIGELFGYTTMFVSIGCFCFLSLLVYATSHHRPAAAG